MITKIQTLFEICRTSLSNVAAINGISVVSRMKSVGRKVICLPPTYARRLVELVEGSGCSLLTNLILCYPFILDGLSGSINITQKGSLGSICDAYYHKDMISAIKSDGRPLGNENDSDSFHLSHSCGQAIITRRDNGLCVVGAGA